MHTYRCLGNIYMSGSVVLLRNWNPNVFLVQSALYSRYATAWKRSRLTFRVQDVEAR